MRIWANRLYPRDLTVTSEAWEEAVEEEGFEQSEPPAPAPVSRQTVVNRETNTVEEHTAEYRNETNTAETQTIYHTEVRVEVVNHNEIKSSEDMEDLANRFAERLREQIFTAAEGVYA